MYILIKSSDCSNPALVPTLTAIKNILKIIQIVGPILLILALFIAFTKGVFNPEAKNFKKKILNSVLALIFVFSMPTLVDAVMKVLGDSFTVTSCWNNIGTNEGEPEYKDPYDQEKTKIIEDKDYDKSKEDTSNNNSNDNNNNNDNSNDNNDTDDTNKIIDTTPRT